MNFFYLIIFHFFSLNLELIIFNPINIFLIFFHFIHFLILFQIQYLLKNITLDLNYQLFIYFVIFIFTIIYFNNILERLNA